MAEEGFKVKSPKNWLTSRAEEVLKCVAGIEGGMTVVDFGCGHGAFGIPASKLVGDEGVVYALDKKRTKLRELRSRAKERGLETRIRSIDTGGETKIPLETDSVDVVLLFDVLHQVDSVEELLDETFRVLKKGGIVSVYPHYHFDQNEVKEKLEAGGFSFIGERRCILNFGKGHDPLLSDTKR